MSLSYTDFNPKKTDIDCLLDAAMDNDTRQWPDDSFAKAAHHPVIKALHEEPRADQVVRYQCPVCRTDYASEQRAIDCSKKEREFAEHFKDVKKGDILHCQYNDGYKDQSFFVEVRGFSHCYSGFRCGSILTVMCSENHYINAESTFKQYKLVTEAEKRKHIAETYRAKALGLQQQAEEILKEVEELESNQQTQERTN